MQCVHSQSHPVFHRPSIERLFRSLALPSADTLDIILSHSFHLDATISSKLLITTREKTHSNVCGAVAHISAIPPVTNVSAASMLSIINVSMPVVESGRNGNELNCIASAPIESHRLSWNGACVLGGACWSLSKFVWGGVSIQS